jgi:hypothetical protein
MLVHEYFIILHIFTFINHIYFVICILYIQDFILLGLEENVCSVEVSEGG